jgi:uncharacterized membrane protein
MVRLQLAPEATPPARVPVGPRAGVPWPLPPLVLGIGALLAGLLIFAPGSLQTKLDVLGFGVCHQLLSHSFILGGHPLPVCARCTGIYLGAGLTWALLAILRPRATGLPAPVLLPVLLLMFLTMAADGVNSTVQSLPGGQGLWETTNFLRIVTGALAGMSIAFLLYPLFNSAFWRQPEAAPEPVLERPFELFGYAAAVAVPVGLALSADGDPSLGWAYWPLALLSVGGLLVLLTLSNTLLVTIFTRREGHIATRWAALTPLALALGLAVAELLLLAELRGLLASVLPASAFPAGMPLAPGVR